MTAAAGDGGRRVTASVRVRAGSGSIDFEANVAAGPISDLSVLPLARSLADAVMDIASDDVRAEGRQVSCRAGCGACCRQLVPVSPVEARRLATVVEEMPEPRRSQVRARFAAARERLERAGLLADVETPPAAIESRRGLGLRYFAQGVACPFLEDESCGIYAERPVACREYLVTSPAANCAAPSAQTIQMVPVPVKVTGALHRLRASADSPPYVTLVDALRWAAAHPEPPPRPGAEVLRDFLGALGAKDAPPPAGSA